MLSRALPRLAIAVLALGLGAASARAASTKVTYLAGSMAYAEVGGLDGLRVGDTVQVFHDTTAVALLKVAFLSTHRAACDTLWTRGRIALGDELRFTPHPVEPVAAAPAATAAAGPAAAPVAAAARAHRPRMRGRVGGRWLSVQANGTGFTQPALDLRFDGTDQGAGHVDLGFDLRSRRTVRTANGLSTTQQFSRVYRADVVVRSLDGHRQVSVGRQVSGALASVSLFDGLLAQAGGERHSFGVFSGTQPDPVSFGVADSVFESGAFVELHSPAAAERRYQFSTGGILSRNHGKVNRDFLFGLASWSSPRFTSTVTQEVDVNTGWKRTAESSVLSPTSTFASVRVTPVRDWGLDGGFDNRRNVRLWRDRVTPADQFDDAYRQGTWVGSDVGFANRFRLTGEVRGSAGADHSHSWTAGAEAYRLTTLHVSLRGRFSQYGGSGLTSRLWSGSLGSDLGPRGHVEATGGVRGTRLDTATAWDQQGWTSFDLDLMLGRRWYLNGGYERDAGGTAGSSDMVQAGLSWRF